MPCIASDAQIREGLAVSDRRPVLEPNLELRRRVGQLRWHQQLRNHVRRRLQKAAVATVAPLLKLVDTRLHPLEVVRPGHVGVSCEVHRDQDASGVRQAPAPMPITPGTLGPSGASAVAAVIPGLGLGLGHTQSDLAIALEVE